MAKGFRVRISRIISSLQGQWQCQSCRSKNPNTLPTNPAPSSSTFHPLHHLPNNENCTTAATIKTKPAIINLRNFSPCPVPPSKPDHSSLKRHVPSASFSVGSGFRPRSTNSDDHRVRDFQWQREDKWHVLTPPEVYNQSQIHTPRRKVHVTDDRSDADDVGVMTGAPHPVRPSLSERRKKKRQAKNKKKTTRRVSTSSADSCGFWSSQSTRDLSEFQEETVTPVYSSPSTSNLRKRKNRKKSKKKVSSLRRSVSSRISSEMPARLSVFQRLIPCKVEGKVRESLAVVKRSEDPYEDFRRSMMEMILEKHMFEEKDLEHLLHCFLSLNSKQHHDIIIRAFSEILDALFSSSS